MYLGLFRCCKEVCEPPCSERYARRGRSVGEIIACRLLNFKNTHTNCPDRFCLKLKDEMNELSIILREK